jgi:hypothetical protein
MSSTYTGASGATQSPASPPAWGAPPVVVLPSDGDALNVASVMQAFKVLADYIAFFQLPFANPAAWTQPLVSFFDATGHRRFVLDHFGLPRGAYSSWTQDWTPASQYTFSNKGSGFYGNTSPQRFYFAVSNGSGTTLSTMFSFAPGQVLASFPSYMSAAVTPNSSRSLMLEVDGTASGNRIEARLSDDYVTATFAADTLISLEFDIAIYSTNNVVWVVGFTTQSEYVNGINDGVFFIAPSSGSSPGNWLCRTTSGGIWSTIDSMQTAGANANQHHMQIVLVGGTVDDSSTSRALFFIDGNLVANITSNLPIGGGLGMYPIFGGFTTAASAPANPVLAIGSVRYTQITGLGTV